MPGTHGVPMSLHAIDEPADDRSIEALVESASQRLMEERAAPKKRRIEELRARYDPECGSDLSALSTRELVERLRAAAAEQRERRAEADATLVFGLKRLDIFEALRERADYMQTLETLTADDDPSIRFQAAQRLLPHALATATFERIRADGVEPEASEAARWLDTLQRRDARPKPWDAS
jgi:hypothetical protein